MTGWSSNVLLKNPVISVLFSCLLPVLRVQSTEYNSVDSVVSPEEKPVRKTPVLCQTGKIFMVFKCEQTDADSLPLVIGERDALWGHFEVHYSGGGQRLGAEQIRGGFLHSVVPRQRLHLHRAQEPHVTCCSDERERGCGVGVYTAVSFQTAIHQAGKIFYSIIYPILVIFFFFFLFTSVNLLNQLYSV